MSFYAVSQEKIAKCEENKMSLEEDKKQFEQDIEKWEKEYKERTGKEPTGDDQWVLGYKLLNFYKPVALLSLKSIMMFIA